MEGLKVGDKVKVKPGVFSSRNQYDEFGDEILIDAVISKILGTDIDDDSSSLYEVNIGIDSELPMVILHSDIA